MINVVILCGESDTANAIYNGIKNHCDVKVIVVESPPSQLRLFRRRVKRLGLWDSFGQLLFILFNRISLYFNKHRLKAHIKKLNLDVRSPSDALVRRVDSVNNKETIGILKQTQPDLVIVYGTRIISSSVFRSVNAPFVNVHAGITPKYRGCHGGYWAMANNDVQNFGVTVHEIDAGIDTGRILYQESFTPSANWINAYVIEQISEAIFLLRNVIRDCENGGISTKESSKMQPSHLWHHPTLWAYFLTWIRLGVK